MIETRKQLKDTEKYSDFSIFHEICLAISQFKHVCKETRGVYSVCCQFGKENEGGGFERS